MSFVDDMKGVVLTEIIFQTKLSEFLDENFDYMLAKGQDNFVIWLYVESPLGWEKKNAGEYPESDDIILVRPPRGRRGVARVKVRLEYEEYLAIELLKYSAKKNQA